MKEKIYNDDHFYATSGNGLDVDQVGPRDPHRDWDIGDYESALDYKQMNKYHRRISSLVIGLVVWVAASFVGAVVLVGGFLELMKYRGSALVPEKALICFMVTFGFLLFVDLMAFGMPFIFYLSYRTQRSLWKSIALTLCGLMLRGQNARLQQRPPGRSNAVLRTVGAGDGCITENQPRERDQL